MKTERTVYFIPRYIAALKYYERLFPLLREAGWEPAFLLFEDGGMVAHCAGRGVPVYTKLIPQEGTWMIPFISHVRAFERMRHDIRKFLDTEKPACIIAEVTVTDQVGMLLYEAKKRGVDTAALQWAFRSAETEHPPISFMRMLKKIRAQHPFFVWAYTRWMYVWLLVRFLTLLDLLAGGHRYRFADVVP